MENENTGGGRSIIGIDPAIENSKTVVAQFDNDKLIGIESFEVKDDQLTAYMEHVTTMLRKSTMPLQTFGPVIQGSRQRTGDNKPQQIPKSPLSGILKLIHARRMG
jgi:hypothetical protein